jgi:MerR family transcriptional regulator, copper efflux regulator
MRDTLTISALAKRSGVPSKTIRYWESLGLLPRAARSHTGYRVFDFESLRYVAFIRKSKAIGLTLAEMREILRLARAGHCPCPEVVHWTAARARAIESHLCELSALLRRLKRIRREWSSESCPGSKCGQVCYLVQELPECKSNEGGKNGKLFDAGCCRGKSCCQRIPRARHGRMPRLPAGLSAPLLPGRLAQRRHSNHN